MDVEEYNITQKENRERVWITGGTKRKDKGNPQKGISRVPLGCGNIGDGEKKGGQKRGGKGTLPCPPLFLKTPRNVVDRAEDGGEEKGYAEAEKNDHGWLDQCNNIIYRPIYLALIKTRNRL